MKTPTRKHLTVFRVFTAQALRYPWTFALIVIAGLIMQGTYLAVPLYLREFFNALTRAGTTAEQLVSILGFIIILWFVDWAVHRVQYLAQMRLEINAMKDLFNDSFDYLLGHSHAFFTSNFSGSLTHKVTKFARSFELLFDHVVSSFFPSFCFVIGAITILSIRNHQLGIVLGIWTVLFLAFQIYVSQWRQPYRVARSETESRITGNLADVIGNQSTVMLFSATEHEKSRFARTVKKWADAVRTTWLVDAWIWLGIGLFMITIQSVLLYMGIKLWAQGLFTVGDFILVQVYLFTTFERLEKINRELRKANDNYSDAVEMVEILNTLHEVHDKHGAKPLVVKDGVVEFKDVDFHFHEEKAVFAGFNLRIAGGEKVALIGPSGAGKTTVTKLLLRLFDVKKGAVEIDGQNISEVTQESLRNAIGFVPQEPVLFHRTLMENIRYGRRNATDEEVIAAATQAFCHDFITALPHGYETYVGERGVKLSGGERQRVAIARAILKDAPILMLDEATSSLDSESELLIQKALGNLMHGKTVIVIAHRLSTIMKMDRIIALENGAIAEEGTHQELLAKKGLYARLWSHQAGGFIQDEA